MNGLNPSLNHSDLRVKNVIVDEEGHLGDRRLGGVRLNNLASVTLLHDLSIDEKQIFLEGYGLSSDQIDSMAPLIKAFNLLNYSTAIKIVLEKNDHKSLADLRLRLQGSLDLYSLSS